MKTSVRKESQPGRERTSFVISRRNISLFTALPGTLSGSMEFVRYLTASSALRKRGVTLFTNIDSGCVVKLLFQPRPSASSETCLNGFSELTLAAIRALRRFRSLAAASRLTVSARACLASEMARRCGFSEDVSPGVLMVPVVEPSEAGLPKRSEGRGMLTLERCEPAPLCQPLMGPTAFWALFCSELGLQRDVARADLALLPFRVEKFTGRAHPAAVFDGAGVCQRATPQAGPSYPASGQRRPENIRESQERLQHSGGTMAGSAGGRPMWTVV